MKKEPQPMTFIYLSYPQNSFVGLLVSQGPKNLFVKNRISPDSIYFKGSPWQERIDTVEREKYMLIPGDRQDLVDMVKKARADHEAAHEKRSRDRQQAIWDFEKSWDAKHPYPSLDIQGLIAPYLLVGPETASVK